MERIPAELWRLAAVIVFGAFASGLDASVVNVGLDTIGAKLHAPLDTVQWVANGYLVALAVSLPVCGWLGRKVGMGRLWLWSLAAFTVASGLCALAPNVTWLIALRVVQGLGAGLLIPAGQTILGQAVGPHRMGRVMSTVGIAVNLAPTVGPTIGGLVLRSLSWPWLFLINLPIGVVGLVLGLRLVPRGRAGDATRLDWPGLALVGLGLPLMVYAFTVAGAHATLLAWPVLVPLVAGLAGLLVFGLRARRVSHPLLDLSLFRNPVYAAASGAAAFTGAALFGATLLFPLYFQILHGLSPVVTGLSLFSMGLGTALILPLSGRLTDRHGGGVVSFWGSVCCVATTVPFVFPTLTGSTIVVQILLLLRGMSIALAAAPPPAAAYGAVRPEQMPDAATQLNILQRLGGALGGALFAVIVARGLAASPVHAFQTAFWWLTGASVISLGWAAWLWFAMRPRRPAVTVTSGEEPAAA